MAYRCGCTTNTGSIRIQLCTSLCFVACLALMLEAPGLELVQLVALVVMLCELVKELVMKCGSTTSLIDSLTKVSSSKFALFNPYSVALFQKVYALFAFTQVKSV